MENLKEDLKNDLIACVDRALALGMTSLALSIVLLIEKYWPEKRDPVQEEPDV